MALKLHCKRSKLFMRSTSEGRHERVTAVAGAVTSVPDWVATTDGYKYGVKDGSIVDLTPPKQVVAASEPVAATKVTEAPEAESTSGSESGESTDDDTEDAEAKPKTTARSRVPKGIVSATTVVKK